LDGGTFSLGHADYEKSQREKDPDKSHSFSEVSKYGFQRQKSLLAKPGGMVKPIATTGSRVLAMKIGQLATRTKTLVETIRYYEKAGVLEHPRRTPAGYREYEESHLQRLTFVRRCRDLGFSLAEVRGLLDLADRTDDRCESVCSIASAHLDEVRAKLSALRRLERSLVRLKTSCNGGRIEECRILESLMR
jgi:DNA-binding transcriptional MerR regulator